MIPFISFYPPKNVRDPAHFDDLAYIRGKASDLSYSHYLHYCTLVHITHEFQMNIPCDKNFLLVPSSRSSVKVKVKYQGHNFQKIAVAAFSPFPIIFSTHSKTKIVI